MHNFEVNGYPHSISGKDIYVSFFFNEEEPGSFAFDQEQMRPHLIKYLEAETAEPFPIMMSKETKENKVHCKGPCFLHLL